MRINGINTQELPKNMRARARRLMAAGVDPGQDPIIQVAVKVASERQARQNARLAARLTQQDTSSVVTA